MRRAAAAGRRTAQVGPFLATFSPAETSPYLNYAIPDDGARPTRSDVDALVTAYTQRELLPRTEFMAETAPEAETALLAAGWTVERRIPVMLCPPGSVVPVAAPVGVELVVPGTDEEIRGMLTVRHEAFGESRQVPDTQVRNTRERLHAGGFAVLARDAATGAPVGGGVAEAIDGGTTEVAGIGVRAAYRRRGIGAAVTALLTSAVHDAGARTVFLTPAGVTEQRMYERIGYVPAGDMVHLRR